MNNRDMLYGDEVSAKLHKAKAAAVPPPAIFMWIPTDQLKFLWGKRLNNLSINWIMSLRPSEIHFINSNEGSKAVQKEWAVTVFVANFESGSMIERIVQMSKVGAYGAETAEELLQATKEQPDFI